MSSGCPPIQVDIEIDVDGVFGPMTRPRLTPQRQAIEDARASERARQDAALGRVVERGVMGW